MVGQTRQILPVIYAHLQTRRAKVSGYDRYAVKFVKYALIADDVKRFGVQN